MEEAIKYINENFANMTPQDCRDYIEKIKNEDWIPEFVKTSQCEQLVQYSAY